MVFSVTYLQNLALSWECFHRDPVATAPWIFHELQGRIHVEYRMFINSHVCLQEVSHCKWLNGLEQSGIVLRPQSLVYLFYFFLQQFHKHLSRQFWVITISEVRTSQYAQLKVMISMLPLAAGRAAFLDAEGSRVWEAVVNCLKMALLNIQHVYKTMTIFLILTSANQYSNSMICALHVYRLDTFKYLAQ